MEKILILGGGLLSFMSLSAQTLSPEVVATSGTSFVSSNAQIEFTVGELVTSSITSGSNGLTQGFHQPQIHFSSIENSGDAFTFSLYPNPTDQFVTVASTEEMDLQVHIYDASGKAIEVSAVFAKKITLDLQFLACGHYILMITTPSGTPLNSYSIIKK